MTRIMLAPKRVCTGSRWDPRPRAWPTKPNTGSGARQRRPSLWDRWRTWGGAGAAWVDRGSGASRWLAGSEHEDLGPGTGLVEHDQQAAGAVVERGAPRRLLRPDRVGLPPPARDRG